MTFPDPVISVAIEPKTKGDQEKLGTAIQKLAEEDPTFQVHQDEETGQTIIKGMGELHLDILVDRMRREFKVEANVGKPQVAYRETIRRAVEKLDYTHKKQTGGSGQYAKVQVTIEPLDTAEGELYEFENKVTGGRIPREYIPSVDHGIQDAMQYGVLAGYPLVGIKATLLDGALHDVDSSEMAFKIAGSMVLKEAVRKADPVLLEPIMAVEVRTPEDYMGDVIGDLNSPSRPDPVHGGHQRREGRPGPRPAVGDVRLRRRPAVARPRAGPTTPCSSTPTPRFPRTSPRRSSRRPGASDRRLRPPGSRSFPPNTRPNQHASPATGARRQYRRSPEEDPQWRRQSSSGPSRTSTSAPSVTSTTARRR